MYSGTALKRLLTRAKGGEIFLRIGKQCRTATEAGVQFCVYRASIDQIAVPGLKFKAATCAASACSDGDGLVNGSFPDFAYLEVNGDEISRTGEKPKKWELAGERKLWTGTLD